MSTQLSDADRASLRSLRTIADYQFGAGAGNALFPTDEPIDIRRTSSGRPRQIIVSGTRVVTYATDGRFTLGYAGGERLADALESPAYRVIVGDDSAPFVRDGKNVFAKFVQDVDPVIRPGDEILVEHYDGELLGVGRAELSADGMMDFASGMAVKVRDGKQ
ncbi:pseudouridine synthase [Halorubraceae archaeon YAN]|nr:pseudouridine synthase [Halorubraceae archaeon YAN]